MLEYVCPVSDLHTRKRIDMLENAQRKAARFVLHNHHSKSSVAAMLYRLGWPSLQHRGRLARLSMLLQMFHDDVRTDSKETIVWGFLLLF